MVKSRSEEEKLVSKATKIIGTEGPDVDIRKVTCSDCSRRRDLYFVGSKIYCVDDALRHLVSLIE